MISIDDSSEFQADFVLATLLDPSTSTGTQYQPSASATSSRPTADVHRRPKSTHSGPLRTGRGRQGTSKKFTHPLEDEDFTGHMEDELWQPTTHATIPPGDGRDRSKRGNGKEQHSWDMNTEFEQRSQNGANLTETSRQLQAAANHDEHSGLTDWEPQAPLLEVEPRTEAVTETRVASQRTGGGVPAVSQVFDPLDVLFGAENMMDVAEEGEECDMQPPAAAGWNTTFKQPKDSHSG